MIIGNRERFAIEAEIEEEVSGWILGHFRFWLCEKPVGDWSDSVDLRGCVRWLRDFHTNPRERHEAMLSTRTAEEVFRLVYDPVIAGGESASGQPQVRDAYSRFHISHLGMSSFERFDLLLLKDANGSERCLWRAAGTKKVFECRLWRNEMEAVAADFCDWFERRGGGTGSPR